MLVRRYMIVIQGKPCRVQIHQHGAKSPHYANPEAHKSISSEIAKQAGCSPDDVKVYDLGISDIDCPHDGPSGGD
jgi:hypothetical protein